MVMTPTACFCTKTRRASRILMRVYDDALNPVGLTVTQFAVLKTIGRLGAPALSELAEATGHDRTSMWRTLQPLGRRGLILAAASRGKAAPIRLTQEGSALVTEAGPLWETAQAHVEAVLGEQAKLLFEVLDRVEDLAA